MRGRGQRLPIGLAMTLVVLSAAHAAALEQLHVQGHVAYELFGYPDPKASHPSNEDFVEWNLRAHGRLLPEVTYQLETRMVADDVGYTRGGFSWRNEEIHRPFFALQSANVEYNPADWLRVRAGKQVIDWTIFDHVQPANLMNPQDASDTFRSVDVGIYAVDLRAQHDDFYAELAVMPFIFVLPRYPQGRWEIIDGDNVTTRQDDPPLTFDESQAGLRLGGQVGNLDVSLLGYVGRDWAGVFDSQLIFVGGDERFRVEVTNRYPRLYAGGMNASQPVGEHMLLRAEVVYFSSPDAIRDDFFLSAVGAELTWDDWRLDLDYLRNDMVNRAEQEITDKGERFFFESFLGVDLRWDRGGRFDAALRGGYDFTQGSWLLQPELSYLVFRNLRISLNAEVVGGDKFSYFERIRHQDRVGTRFKYLF